jgi:PAS domain S-box-containing protein
MNILLLEDDLADADLTKRGLAESISGCTVQIASDLKEAYELLNSGFLFDVALLDMNLPDGNGIDLLIDIRRMELNIAVVMLTGSGNEEVAVAALRAGANDYVVKRQGYISQLPGIINFAIDSFRQNLQLKSDIINVLYIEHHTLDIDLTIYHFKQFAPHIHIDTVSTAEEALMRLKTSGESVTYNVILMDFHLTGMSAMELIKILRQERKIDIPIILISGQGNEDEAVQALKVGANEYITKSEKYLNRLPSLIISAYQHCMLKRKEAALSESESKYRLLADNSGDVIFVLDMEMNYTYISPAVKSLRGYEPDEAIKQKITEVLTPDSYNTARNAISEIMSDKLFILQQRTIELEMIRKDNSTVWTEVKASLIKDKNNKPMGILGVSRDISKRKYAMDELRKLSRAIEQSPVSVVITDTNGNIEYVNPKFSEITGYSAEEAKGKNPRILKSGYTSQDEYAVLWQTILSGGEWRGEFKNRRKDSSFYWEQVSISAIKDSQGEMTHLLAVFEDVTEKKGIIDELIKAKEKAEESTKLKSAFLANIGHEIRTPLSGIIGFANLLRNPELTGEEKEKYLGILKESGNRMLNTLNDIIEMSSIEARESIRSNNIVDINELINILFDSYAQEANKKGLSFLLDNKLKNISFSIFTDRNKLESILSNLLKNSVKFTSAGYIEFGSRTEDEQLLFYVKDTGIGIPSERLSSIFHRFVQADLSVSRPFEGSGLGLSIARAYAELLEGKITVESQEGKGSTFHFIMPFRLPEQKTE